MLKTTNLKKSNFSRQILSGFKVVNFIAWVLLFFNSINEYPSLFNDFRNRVVGARLMKDGVDPYFYIWKEGNPIRYYDSGVDPAGFLSGSTATPFFHWLLGPVCDLPQYQLNLLWFCVQWLSIITCVLIAVSFTSDALRKQVLLFVTAALIASIGFRQHFFQMQVYLLLPALIMLAIYVWKNKAGWYYLLVAGACLASVVLIRPTLLLLFLPLVFYKKMNSLLVCTGLVLACYGLFAVINRVQRNNWRQFYLSIEYRSGKIPMPAYKAVPFTWLPYSVCEGVQIDNEKSQKIAHQLIDQKSENANFHFIYEAVTGKFPPSEWLFVFQLLSMAAGVIMVLFITNKKSDLYWYDLLITGFTVYWFVEFFSPVSAKLLYYFVMFLYPVLLYFSLIQKLKWFPTLLIATGIFLSIFKFPFLKMNCTLGQGLIMLGLLADIWMRGRTSKEKSRLEPGLSTM